MMNNSENCLKAVFDSSLKKCPNALSATPKNPALQNTVSDKIRNNFQKLPFLTKTAIFEGIS